MGGGGRSVPDVERCHALLRLAPETPRTVCRDLVISWRWERSTVTDRSSCPTVSLIFFSLCSSFSRRCCAGRRGRASAACKNRSRQSCPTHPSAVLHLRLERVKAIHEGSHPALGSGQLLPPLSHLAVPLRCHAAAQRVAALVLPAAARHPRAKSWPHTATHRQHDRSAGEGAVKLACLRTQAWPRNGAMWIVPHSGRICHRPLTT